ncbi:hypothetical protein XENOCAPTIV_020786, partial [Xenoophorus captivus]
GTASACSGSNISRAHSDGNLSSAAERIRDSKVRNICIFNTASVSIANSGRRAKNA